LLRGEPPEEIGIVGNGARCPCTVVLEQFGQAVHDAMLSRGSARRWKRLLDRDGATRDPLLAHGGFVTRAGAEAWAAKDAKRDRGLLVRQSWSKQAIGNSRIRCGCP
jgi:hypothetical protein